MITPPPIQTELNTIHPTKLIDTGGDFLYIKRIPEGIVPRDFREAGSTGRLRLMATDTNKGDSSKKRERSIQRTFKNAEGPETSRAQLDTTHVVFTFNDGRKIEVDMAPYFGGSLPEPCVGRAAAAFGLSTSGGNAGNTVDDDTPEGIRDAVEKRVEVWNDGDWATGRDDGPGTSLMLEALRAFRTEKGAPTDDATMLKFKEQFKTDKVTVKKFMGHPGFAAHYNRIQLERRQARAASEGGVATDADLLQ